MAIKKTANKRSSRDRRGRFTPGSEGGPGRPPGSPNRVPLHLREVFATVFERAGGEQMLLRIARKHPRDFLALLVRLQPRLLEGSLDVDVVEHAPAKVVIYIPDNGRGGPEFTERVAREQAEREPATGKKDGAV